MSIREAYDPDTRWGRPFGVVDRVNYSPPDPRFPPFRRSPSYTRGASPVAPDDLPVLGHTITPAAHYHRLVSKEQP